MQKLKNCNSLDELNMSAFEFLTKLTNEEVLSITYIPYQKDCYEVEMTLKIERAKPDIICLNREKTYEEAKNLAAKSALRYIK